MGNIGRGPRDSREYQWLESDLANLQRVMDACEAPVFYQRKVPVEEKTLSVAAPFVRGRREPVMGYKPQLGSSGKLFVIELTVPSGNAADSGQLVPMFEQATKRTRGIPGVVNVDDGGASRAGQQDPKTRGV